MPTFIYSAVERSGKTAKGEREADSEKALAQALKSEGLFLLEARERTSVGSRLLNLSAGEIIYRLKPISLVEKMFFSRNLSVMIGAGLSLTRALKGLEEETSNTKFKKVIADVNNSVTKGKTFAESLRVHQKVFGEVFTSMIEVGETSGKLTIILKLLANQMKKDHDLKKRVKGAMMYRGIILMVLFVMGTFMMLYVVPTLTQTIKDLGVPLPVTTRVIIGLSELVANYYIWLLLSIILIVASLWRALKTAKGKEIFDKLIIKVPIFGPLVKKFNTAPLFPPPPGLPEKLSFNKFSPPHPG